MKKTRGKKVKANSKKNLSKPVFSLKQFLPALLIVAVLLLTAIILNVTNMTGNATVTMRANSNDQCGTGLYASFPISCGNLICGEVSSDCAKVVVISSGKWSNTWIILSEDGFFAKILLYIFGLPISSESISQTSAGIITIAMWLLLFITFSDIIASFSTFSKPIAWGIGFLIAIIAANLGWIVSVTAWIIGAFAFLGSLAVVAGLVFAFGGFLGINFGVGKFAEWALKRRATMSAHQAAAGGKKVAGALEGMGEIEKALERLGLKS